MQKLIFCHLTPTLYTAENPFQAEHAIAVGETLKSADERVKLMATSLAQSQQRTKELQERLTGAEAALQKASTEEQDRSAVEKQIAEQLAAQQERLQAAFDRKMRQLEQCLSVAEERAERAESEAHELQIESQLSSSLGIKVYELEREREARVRSVEALQKAIKELHSKHELSIAANQDLRSHQEQLRKDKVVLQQRLDLAATDGREAGGANEADLVVKLKAVESQLQDERQAHAGTRQRLSELESVSAGGAKAAEALLASERARMQDETLLERQRSLQQVQGLHKKLATLTAEREVLTRERDGLRAELEQMRSEWKQLHVNFAEVRAEHTHFKAENQRLQQQIQAVQVGANRENGSIFNAPSFAVSAVPMMVPGNNAPHSHTGSALMQSQHYHDVLRQRAVESEVRARTVERVLHKLIASGASPSRQTQPDIRLDSPLR